VDHYAELGEHELSQPPDGAHDFAGVTGVTLINRYDGAVVEDSFPGQIHIRNLRHQELNHGQEDALGGLAHVTVLLRRLSDDDCLIYRIFPVSDRCYVEHREKPGQAVESGVISERTFLFELALVNVSLYYYLGISRHFQIHGLAFGQPDRALAQKAGE